MSAATPPSTDPYGPDPHARGLGLCLLTAFVAAIGIAWVVASLLFPQMYITFFMPILFAWAVGTPVAFVRRKAIVEPRVPVLVMAAVATGLAYLGYHVATWVNVTDILVTKLPSMMDHAASDPYLEVQGFIREQTGADGFWGYITLVSTVPDFAALNPVGVIGSIEPGPVGTLLIAAVEGALAMTAAVWLVDVRSSADVEAAVAQQTADTGPQVREVIARTDQSTTLAAMNAIDRGDHEEAGRILRRPTVDDDFVLAMTYNPYTHDTYVLEVQERTRDGLQTWTRLTLSSWEGQALWDELRMTER